MRSITLKIAGIGLLAVAAFVFYPRPAKQLRPSQHPIADDSPIASGPKAASVGFAKKQQNHSFDPAKAPESLRFTLDINEDSAARGRNIHLLSKSLKPEEIKAIIAFLLEKHEEDQNQVGHALKSDLMDLLTRQTSLSSELTQVFLDIYHDGSQNVVIRDYAIQHLATLYERFTEPVSWPASEVVLQEKAIRSVLWEALSEKDSSIAGTSLLALSRLSEGEGRADFDRTQIGREALTIAENSRNGELVRVAAVQVCGLQKNKAALPFLIKAIQSETDGSLRISAIGALGALGGQSEVPLLKEIEKDGSRLKPAAALALRRINQRLGQL